MAMVGQETTRVDGREKVTGRACYAADTSVNDVTYAALVQATIAQGSIDRSSLLTAVEAAMQLPGVLHVLSPENCDPLGRPPEDFAANLPFERRPPLSDLCIAYYGQHVALIVAETQEQADLAAARFTLCYHAEPALTSMSSVLHTVGTSPDETAPVRSGVYYPDHFAQAEDEKLQDERGAPPTRATPGMLAAVFSTPVYHHNPIELVTSTAEWDGDVLTLHDSVRWITGMRRTLATQLAMPEEKIRILAPFIGGAFGSKGFLWMHSLLVAVAARQLGRPVRLVLTRAQCFTSSGHRPATLQQFLLAADTDGRFCSLQHHTLTSTSTLAQFVEPAGTATRNLYSSEHASVSHGVARTHNATPCFMRAPGFAPGLFALEAMVDRVALEQELDPLEVRIRNHAAVDPSEGKPWTSKHLLRCYREAASRFGWEGRSLAPRSMRRGRRLVGWGMASAIYPGRKAASGCRAWLATDGRFRFASAVHEIGTGVRTVMTQVAADASGLRYSDIDFLSGDSLFPDAPYAGGSVTTATVGASVQATAEKLKQALLQAVCRDQHSIFYLHPAGCIDVRDGCFVSSIDSTKREELGPFATRAIERGESFTSECKLPAETMEEHSCYSFGAHFCEVEVDEALGRVSVTRWAGTFDVGRVLNPKLSRSQIIGGVTFGIGQTLMEGTFYDRETAAPLNPSLGEYLIPTQMDVPDFDITFLDEPDPHVAPLGARGVGEIGSCGASGALVNAVSHATGRQMNHLPMRADDLFTLVIS